MKMIRGGLGGPEDPVHRARARRRRRRRPGLPGRRPVRPAARDQLGPAPGRHHRGHLRRLRHWRRAARRGARNGPGGLALRGAHLAPGRRHPAPDPPRRRRAAPDAVGRLPAASLESALDRPHGADRPATPGLPARRGGHDTAAAGPHRHLRAGPGPRRAHGEPLAGRAADLHRPTLGRGARRSSAGPVPRRPAWPPPSSHPAPSPVTSSRSTSGAPSTSTAACTRPPTRTCCAPMGSTSSS